MPENDKCRVYEKDVISRVTGHTLRPGGFELTSRMMEFCNFAPGAKVVDVGCGSGATVEYLIDTFGLNAVGIDPSMELLERGRARNPELPLMYGRGEALPFAQESMDGVITECSFSLMGFGDYIWKEFWRVLKKGGWLAISDLYLRNKRAGKKVKSLPLDCCLCGAETQEDIIESCCKTGFNLVFWEDHSKILNSLVINLIMQYGSMDSFWAQIIAPELCRSDINCVVKEAKPGYFLLIAQKP